MYHINPVTDANRAIDEQASRDAFAHLQETLRVRREKQFKAAMTEALTEDPYSNVLVEGGKKRQAIDVAFQDATDETHNLIINLIRDGANGKDVQTRCKMILEHFASNYAGYSELQDLRS